MNQIYGLVGEKLAHSFSPLIHKLIWDCDYGLFELSEPQCTDFLKRREFSGVNVTIPYKVLAYRACDTLDEAARKIGCVNTLLNRNGSLQGYNTDYAGFLYCAERAGISFGGQKVLILGSGGTSLTARAVAAGQGAREVVVVSRNGENNYENLHRHADADVIVNTTPVGMYPGNGKTPIDLAMFGRCGAVMDMIYNPLTTALLDAARQRGVRYANGLPMLVAQGVRAAEIFSGRRFPEEVTESVIFGVLTKMQNVILVGMPGSGKTSIGRKLAGRLGRPFVDTDALIEERTGRKVPGIIREDGEEEFRRIESEAVFEAGKLTSAVIACGGGSVLKAENRLPLTQNGRVYYVKRDIGLLSTDGRPLSKSTDALFDMLAKREPLYKSICDMEVENIDINSCVEQLLDDFLCRSNKNI
ncbi:MAG: hypothetical protein FWF05_02750 [Oscillospiraceae bacterium]|nr:hypothetical protein [Oscillospiraceae bacterium]